MVGTGRRHPLIMYRKIVNRWWPEMLAIGLVLLLLAWLINKNPLGLERVEAWRWQGLGVLGIGIVLAALFLLVLRGMAYVRVLPAYVKLVTPFLRLNISHKRLRRATTAEMRMLFPPNQMRGWKREVVASLGGRTAVVLELNGWPADPKMMRLFLSNFFFKDSTPHFVILVDDWMRLSTELESMRAGEGKASPTTPRREVNQSILSRLPRKDS